MSHRETFRPRSNLLLAGSLDIVTLGVGLSRLWTDGVLGALPALAWSACVMYATHLLFVRPRLLLFDEGITIVNPLQEITVGWDQVQAIDARYTMSLVVDGKRYYAWAAPAPGRYHARSVHPAEIRGLRVDPTDVRVGESPRSDSGVAAHLTRLRFDAFTARGQASGIETLVRPNRTGAGVLAALVLLGAALSLLHG